MREALAVRLSNSLGSKLAKEKCPLDVDLALDMRLLAALDLKLRFVDTPLLALKPMLAFEFKNDEAFEAADIVRGAILE